jgi:uncharacterized membrane protein
MGKITGSEIVQTPVLWYSQITNLHLKKKEICGEVSLNCLLKKFKEWVCVTVCVLGVGGGWVSTTRENKFRMTTSYKVLNKEIKYKIYQEHLLSWWQCICCLLLIVVHNSFECYRYSQTSPKSPGKFWLNDSFIWPFTKFM